MQARPQHNAIHDKLCTLDGDKLPVCCVQTQMLNQDETDNFSFCGHETEVIGIAVLNKKICDLLVLSCRDIENSYEKVDDNDNISSNEKIVTIEQNSFNSDQSHDNKEGTSIINIHSYLCVNCDIDYFQKIIMSAVYPTFYEEWMISEKEHSKIKKYILNENWLTEELMHELKSFRPNSNVALEEITKFESMCKHIFPSGRKFANYRQVDQYITVFLENWNCIKHREGGSFRCFYAKSEIER